MKKDGCRRKQFEERSANCAKQKRIGRDLQTRVLLHAPCSLTRSAAASPRLLNPFFVQGYSEKILHPIRSENNAERSDSNLANQSGLAPPGCKPRLRTGTTAAPGATAKVSLPYSRPSQAKNPAIAAGLNVTWWLMPLCSDRLHQFPIAIHAALPTASAIMRIV